MDNKYNGWTNYATWRVNLEIFDGIDWSDSINGDPHEDLEALIYTLKERAIEAVTNCGELESGLAYDYAMAFLDEVNYAELARHIASMNKGLVKEEIGTTAV